MGHGTNLIQLNNSPPSCNLEMRQILQSLRELEPTINLHVKEWFAFESAHAAGVGGDDAAVHYFEQYWRSFLWYAAHQSLLHRNSLASDALMPPILQTLRQLPLALCVAIRSRLITIMP